MYLPSCILLSLLSTFTSAKLCALMTAKYITFDVTVKDVPLTIEHQDDLFIKATDPLCNSVLGGGAGEVYHDDWHLVYRRICHGVVSGPISDDSSGIHWDVRKSGDCDLTPYEKCMYSSFVSVLTRFLS